MDVFLEIICTLLHTCVLIIQLLISSSDGFTNFCSTNLQIVLTKLSGYFVLIEIKIYKKNAVITLYFIKKGTFEHFQIRENRIRRFVVSVFDLMSSLYDFGNAMSRCEPEKTNKEERPTKHQVISASCQKRISSVIVCPPSEKQEKSDKK